MSDACLLIKFILKYVFIYIYVGNGTLYGASANIVCAGVAEKLGHKITFFQYFKYELNCNRFLDLF